MLMSRMFALAIAGSFVCANTQAATILSNSSFGYYNHGLGTLLDSSGVLDPFPCANIGCGDATVSYPSAPNLSAAAGQLGNWLGNSAPSGGAWSGSPLAVPGTWTVNTETAISYAINAGTGLANLHLSLGVDNGVFVWLNGVYVFGARAAGGSSLGEYVINSLPNLTGTNYLQVLREDHGGGTGFDILLTGDQVVRNVPEPSSIAMLGLGLLSVAALKRRGIYSRRKIR
jgi:PEP-CTERM motif